MPVDNRDNPAAAACDEPGCTNTVALTTGLTGKKLRQAERKMVDNGWSWYVDYATVHSTCAEHGVVRNS